MLLLRNRQLNGTDAKHGHQQGAPSSDLEFSWLIITITLTRLNHRGNIFEAVWGRVSRKERIGVFCQIFSALRGPQQNSFYNYSRHLPFSFDVRKCLQSIECFGVCYVLSARGFNEQVVQVKIVINLACDKVRAIVLLLLCAASVENVGVPVSQHPSLFCSHK